MKRLPFDYAVRNLGRSPVRLALSLLGSTLVVLLALSAGGFVRGMSQSLVSGGTENNVMLLGAGSEESVERSEISSAVPDLLMGNVSGIRSRLGVAYVSPEVHVQTNVAIPGTPQVAQALVRGITPAAFLVHSQAVLVEGRMPEAARNEIAVGALTARKLGVAPGRVAIGQQIAFNDMTWTIVGRFAAPGSVMESEIWCPLTDLQVASQRDNLSCVVVTLDSAEFDDVDAFVKQRLDLELIAMRESDYYRKLAAFFGPIRAMVWATALLIAGGAILGGLNTMYAAFASRVREVGTLQAIGFSRRAIVLNLAQESLLAAATGTLIAAGIAIAFLNGVVVPFSMGVFGLRIDAVVVTAGIVAGLAIGLLGALPPAIRCLQLSIPAAPKAA